MNPVVSHETFFLFSSAFRRAQLEHMESWVQTSPAFFCCWKCAIFSRKISYDQECIGCTYNLTKQKRKKCICKKSRIHAGGTLSIQYGALAPRFLILGGVPTRTSYVQLGTQNVVRGTRTSARYDVPTSELVEVSQSSAAEPSRPVENRAFDP